MKKGESVIHAELERLCAAHGGVLHPEVVVEAARLTDSPLHGSFEWDDSQAAHRYRLWQARSLIRVVVTFEPISKDEDVKIRAFVSLSQDRLPGGPGYRLTRSVMADDGQRAQLLSDARAEMATFRAKYRALAELAAVLQAMDDVLEEETSSRPPKDDGASPEAAA